MAYIDAQLSERVAYGFRSGPEYKTLIVNMANGREQRNGQWLYPKLRFSAQYVNFKEADRMEILGAFHACRGRLHCFRFKDWSDPAAINEAIAPDVGTSNPVQLIKTYTLGGQATQRLIQATDNTAVIRKDGVPVAGTLDPLTGKFTPAAPWAAGAYTWSGPIFVWVRFDSDHNAFSIDEYDAANTDIELVEVRR